MRRIEILQLNFVLNEVNMARKLSWVVSDRANWMFSVSTVLTFVILCVDLAGIFWDPDWSLQFVAGGFSILTFVVIFAAICATMCSQAFLWAGMMIYSFRGERRATFRQVILVLLQVIGLSFGSAFVYIFIYRRERSRLKAGGPT